ncbi:MAG: hypothetical protein EZS28_021019 [Streblomastix strix]|uniref:Uncharacterized protein n=1 Tax=Streblomastix strix TaxID=222440 RepID=A0A5J4VLD9_9EUKA|nr:MAG: hypothetical protein EZS28_021019 [Streblomastix strix]
MTLSMKLDIEVLIEEEQLEPFLYQMILFDQGGYTNDGGVEETEFRGDRSNPDAFFGEEDKDDEMSISDKFDG